MFFTYENCQKEKTLVILGFLGGITELSRPGFSIKT